MAFSSSVIIFLSSMISVWYTLCFFFVRILGLFLNGSPVLGENLHEHYLDSLLSKSRLDSTHFSFWRFIFFLYLEYIALCLHFPLVSVLVSLH